MHHSIQAPPSSSCHTGRRHFSRNASVHWSPDTPWKWPEALLGGSRLKERPFDGSSQALCGLSRASLFPDEIDIVSHRQHSKIRQQILLLSHGSLQILFAPFTSQVSHMLPFWKTRMARTSKVETVQTAITSSGTPHPVPNVEVISHCPKRIP